MTRAPERLRRQVRDRAQGQCEYCRIHEEDVVFPHEADHIIAEKHGGPTTLENLAQFRTIPNTPAQRHRHWRTIFSLTPTRRAVSA